MSRLGKKPIDLPSGVEVKVDGQMCDRERAPKVNSLKSSPKTSKSKLKTTKSSLLKASTVAVKPVPTTDSTVL